MTDQTLSLMPEDGKRLVRDAQCKYRPVKTFALFSGGGDSSVLTDWAHSNGLIDAAVFIDTGTALPGVAEFCWEFCRDRNIPYRVYGTRGPEWERLVAEHGFPGPSSHRYAYVRLKERALDALVREHKTKRTDRVMLLTGVRRYESGRRKMGRVRPCYRDGATVWVAPLIDWTNEKMAAYKERYNIRPSDVSALIHRSGECNCGAFAAEGEREMLKSLWPEWFYWKIARHEERLSAEGSPRCVWGAKHDEAAEDAPGPLCSDCQLRMEAA